MSNTDMQATDRGQLQLSGEQTILRIAELKAQLLESLAAHRHLVLDLEQVRRADLTFLQLLCSAHRTARQSGGDLKIVNLPEAVEDAVMDAGFLRNNMACGQGCDDSCLWLENEPGAKPG